MSQEKEMSDQQHAIEACNVQIEGLHRELAEKDRQLDGLQQQIMSMRDLLSRPGSVREASRPVRPGAEHRK